jgi:molecular chaperone DnaK
MKKEAEVHAAEDVKKKDLIEARNIADNLIYTTEKTLKDAGDKVQTDIKKEITDKIAELRKTKDSDNIEDIKEKTNQLSQALQKIGAEMYKKDSQQDKPEGDKKDKNKNTEEGDYKEKQ